MPCQRAKIEITQKWYVCLAYPSRIRDVLRYLVVEMPSYLYYQYEYQNSTNNLYLYQEV